MKMYVEMDELQFEKYKESLRKPTELTGYTSNELAAALLNVIQKEGGRSEVLDTVDSAAGRSKNAVMAKVTNSNFMIYLVVEKYGR